MASWLTMRWIYRINQNTIGQVPALLQNLLEVRGIGLLDIRAIFGGRLCAAACALKLSSCTWCAKRWSANTNACPTSR